MTDDSSRECGGEVNHSSPMSNPDPSRAALADELESTVRNSAFANRDTACMLRAVVALRAPLPPTLNSGADEIARSHKALDKWNPNREDYIGDTPWSLDDRIDMLLEDYAALSPNTGDGVAGEPVEIRKKNDAIDEIIINGGSVHIEQMSADGWFMGVAAADGSYWQFWFGAKNRKSHVEFRHTEMSTAEEEARRKASAHSRSGGKTP